MENKRTILIVEDDKYIIHFLSVSLKEEAYTFWTAGTVKEALSLFYANRPDLVILDLGLPDGDRTRSTAWGLGLPYAGRWLKPTAEKSGRRTARKAAPVLHSG